MKKIKVCIFRGKTVKKFLAWRSFPLYFNTHITYLRIFKASTDCFSDMYTDFSHYHLATLDQWYSFRWRTLYLFVPSSPLWPVTRVGALCMTHRPCTNHRSAWVQWPKDPKKFVIKSHTSKRCSSHSLIVQVWSITSLFLRIKLSTPCCTLRSWNIWLPASVMFSRNTGIPGVGHCCMTMQGRIWPVFSSSFLFCFIFFCFFLQKTWFLTSGTSRRSFISQN